MLKSGDWVKQYSAGYWQIVDIKPKYAEEDGENTKKGDLIGSWALLKKGFTPKMKFRLDFECVDIYWCKPISESELCEISEYFEAHEKESKKFSSAVFADRPAIVTYWLELPEEQKEAFREVVSSLPARFTENILRSILTEKGMWQYVCKPSAESNATLKMKHSLWELDENFDIILKEPILEYSEK
ncbi:MAG: hypothetical protein IJX55_09045 [Clostridia bacterium]|nr:hypothetical protein [Clostridia bacterium]